MRKLSAELLAHTLLVNRKALRLTQAQTAEAAGINRSVLCKMESGRCLPTVDQLLALSQVLGFSMDDVLADADQEARFPVGPYNIVVVGAGYVGLSLAVLLAQHNHVTAVDISEEKIRMLQSLHSPIQDDYIEKYLSESKAGQRRLDLSAVLDGTEAYRRADYIIVSVPTNYDQKTNFFDCSAVESVIRLVLSVNPH